jgi:quinol monooxygenase YgiN
MTTALVSALVLDRHRETVPASRGMLDGSRRNPAAIRGDPTVIVRVLVARVLPQHAARFNDVLRAKLADLQTQPGLVYAKLARRFAEDGEEEVVLFEEWRTPSDLWAWSQGRLGQPRLLPGTEQMVHHLTISHYEALDVLPDDLNLTVTWTDDGSGGRQRSGT